MDAQRFGQAERVCERVSDEQESASLYVHVSVLYDCTAGVGAAATRKLLRFAAQPCARTPVESHLFAW
eukprot:282363-Pleurochrysis_carterae.AAC.1